MRLLANTQRAARTLALLLALAAATAPPALAVEPAGDLRHPIEVRIRALDPVQLGALLRLEVTVMPSVDLHAAQVELLGTDEARKVGTTTAALGTLAAGAAAVTTFAVQLPAAGHRFLLTFDVRGDGPTAPLARQATFNVLPNGPADPGVVRTTSSGAKVVEYTARRLP